MERFSRLFVLLPALACMSMLGACSSFQEQSFNIFTDENPRASAKTNDANATMLRLAEKAYEKGEYGIAAQLYFNVAQRAPETPEVMVKLGFALLKAGSGADAEKFFRALLEKEPKNVDAFRGLGHSLVLQKRPFEAISLYRQAIGASAKPEAQNYAGLGAALDLVGKHEEARAAYAAGLRLAPHDYALRNNLAISYALSGDTARAKEILAGLPQPPASRPEIFEGQSRSDALKTSSARRMTVLKHRRVAVTPTTPVNPARSHAANATLRRESFDRPATVRATRISRKADADLPIAETGNSIIFIRTGRASAARVEARNRPAMSFQSEAATPEEAAAEVLALLEKAARGPQFVWQQAQRPSREQNADR